MLIDSFNENFLSSEAYFSRILSMMTLRLVYKILQEMSESETITPCHYLFLFLLRKQNTSENYSLQ